jgi:D-methionine transport system substrate-binding protein
MRAHFTRFLVFSAMMVTLLSGTAGAVETLKVGVNPVPHGEILEQVKPVLKAQGVDLQIVVFSDYVQPNLALEDKSLDANYFQNKPYLDTFNRDHRTDIVQVPGSNEHIEPFGAYSQKIKNLKDLKDGAKIGVPNDPANEGRALQLLQKAGLITLKDPSNILSTPKDIVGNPKHLKFAELEAAQLPRALPDLDLATINANYALEAGLNPSRDALVVEDQHSIYANFIAARPDNVNSPALAKLVKALHSPEVRQFIETKYKGAVIPAF